MDFGLIKKVWAVAAPTDPPDNPLGVRFNTLGNILAVAINVVFYVGLALTIIFLIMGGIRYVTSGGSKEGAESARNSITNAIIGFIVVIGAWAIKVVVQNVLGANLTGGLPVVPVF